MLPEEKIEVLVADDVNIMRRLIVSSLRQLGCTRITEVADGKAALIRLKTGHYDLLITDWMMPYISGIELTKIIRSDEKIKDLPIIMITALTKKEQVKEALTAKVNEYLIKPFNTQMLQEKMELALPYCKELSEAKSKKQIDKKASDSSDDDDWIVHEIL